MILFRMPNIVRVPERTTLFQIILEPACAGKACSRAVMDQGVHISGKRDHFRPLGGKFTRFLWDK